MGAWHEAFQSQFKLYTYTLEMEQKQTKKTLTVRGMVGWGEQDYQLKVPFHC